MWSTLEIGKHAGRSLPQILPHQSIGEVATGSYRGGGESRTLGVTVY